MASTPRPLRPNTTQRDRIGTKHTRVQVRLASKPRDYVPGSGPPLQPLSLLPAQDSTAYIVERILLPSAGLAADGKPLPKRMTYIVGWHDLPAARLLVPAMKILEYVSPREVETWVWDMELEMEKERAKLEEKRKKTPEPVTGKRKRGRPPVQTQIEAGVVAELESTTATKSRSKQGAMSLSTPQKVRMESFEGLSEDDLTPSRQLERELLHWAYESESADRMDSDLVDFDSEMDGFEEEIRRDVMMTGADLSMDASQAQNSASGVSLMHQPAQALMENAAFPYSGNPSRPAAPHTVSHTTSFKPAAWSSSQFASYTAGVDQGDTAAKPGSAVQAKTMDKESASKVKPTSRKTKRAKPRPKPASEDGNADWEVKRIEGMETYDVEGRGLVRYFRVRWEGNWPPDQNPTWEPEENLSATLVRNYMKHPRRHKRTVPMSKPKPSLVSSKARDPARKYSSVSELFMEAESTGTDQREEGGEGIDTGSEVFVVDEDMRAKVPRNANGAP